MRILVKQVAECPCGCRYETHLF